MGALSVCVWAIRRLVLVIVVVLLVPKVLVAFDNAGKYGLTKIFFGARTIVMETIGHAVRSTVPTWLHGRDRTDWFVIVIVLLTGHLAGRYERKVRKRIRMRQVREKVSGLVSVTPNRSRAQFSRSAGIAVMASSVFGAASATQADTGSRLRDPSGAVHGFRSNGTAEPMAVSRAEGGENSGSWDSCPEPSAVTGFLTSGKVASETNCSSATSYRPLALLSVDIVGAPTIAKEEEFNAAQAGFGQCREMVERIFNDNRSVKMAWTPNGVLACFTNVDVAVRAAQSLIRYLACPGTRPPQESTGFKVRCGISCGFIDLVDGGSLEQVMDGAVERANRLRNVAGPNSVAIAEAIIKRVGDANGFEATENVVDGLKIALWRPDKPAAK